MRITHGQHGGVFQLSGEDEFKNEYLSDFVEKDYRAYVTRGVIRLTVNDQAPEAELKIIQKNVKRSRNMKPKQTLKMQKMTFIKKKIESMTEFIDMFQSRRSERKSDRKSFPLSTAEQTQLISDSLEEIVDMKEENMEEHVERTHVHVQACVDTASADTQTEPEHAQTQPPPIVNSNAAQTQTKVKYYAHKSIMTDVTAREEPRTTTPLMDFNSNHVAYINNQEIAPFVTPNEQRDSVVDCVLKNYHLLVQTESKQCQTDSAPNSVVIQHNTKQFTTTLRINCCVECNQLTGDDAQMRQHVLEHTLKTVAAVIEGGMDNDVVLMERLEDLQPEQDAVLQVQQPVHAFIDFALAPDGKVPEMVNQAVQMVIGPQHVDAPIQHVLEHTLETIETVVDDDDVMMEGLADLLSNVDQNEDKVVEVYQPIHDFIEDITLQPDEKVPKVDVEDVQLVIGQQHVDEPIQLKSEEEVVLNQHSIPYVVAPDHIHNNYNYHNACYDLCIDDMDQESSQEVPKDTIPVVEEAANEECADDLTKFGDFLAKNAEELGMTSGDHGDWSLDHFSHDFGGIDLLKIG